MEDQQGRNGAAGACEALTDAPGHQPGEDERHDGHEDMRGEETAEQGTEAIDQVRAQDATLIDAPVWGAKQDIVRGGDAAAIRSAQDKGDHLELDERQHG